MGGTLLSTSHAVPDVPSSTSGVSSSEIEQAFHQELYFEQSVNRLTERRLLRATNGRRCLHFDFPQCVCVGRDRLICSSIDLLMIVLFQMI